MAGSFPFIVVTAALLSLGHPQQPHRLTHPPVHEVVRDQPLRRGRGSDLASSSATSCMAIPAGQLMHRYGYKAWHPLPASSCSVPAAWLFWPAARANGALLVLSSVAQFVIGCGLSFLETGANSFHRSARILGIERTPAQLLAGLQPPRLHHRRTHRHALHLLWSAAFGRRDHRHAGRRHVSGVSAR
jgi:hypothetical protein